MCVGAVCFGINDYPYKLETSVSRCRCFSMQPHASLRSVCVESGEAIMTSFPAEIYAGPAPPHKAPN